jgi:putative peptidoglycan lipid II flippase
MASSAAAGNAAADVALAAPPPGHPSDPQGSLGTPPAALSRRALVGAAAVIALGNILSRGLGLVREQVIAATFGATAGTDAYVLARTLPLILYDLLVGTVITAAFVPVFVQVGRQDERHLWRLVSTILTLATLAFTLVAALLALLAEPLIGVIGGGFAQPGQQALAASLLRVALVSVVFQGLAGLLTSVLYAQNRFTLPAFANATYNAGIIVGVVVLASRLGVAALAVGLVIGAAAQFALQAAGLRAFWRFCRPRLDLGDPALRQVLALAGTVAAGMVVTVAGQLIDRNLASHLAEGSLTSMQYATTVIQFPLGIVGLATSYAVLPTLARFSDGSPDSRGHYRDTLTFGLKVVLLLMLPALAGLVALAQPVIAVLLERGAFTPADTARTTAIFLAYAPMLPLTAVDYLLINAFYARQNARTPVLVGVVCVLIYLAVALSLIRPFGAVGLAFANAVQNSAHAVILLVLLGRSLPELRLAQALAPFLARTIPAALVMGLAVWLAWPALSRAGGLVGLAGALLLGLVVYGGLIQLLGVQEARSLVALARHRLGR